MTDLVDANEFITPRQLLILLFLFRFSFILQTKMGLFLLFFSTFIFFSLVTHIRFSLLENDLRPNCSIENPFSVTEASR